MRPRRVYLLPVSGRRRAINRVTMRLDAEERPFMILCGLQCGWSLRYTVLVGKVLEAFVGVNRV